PADVARGSRRGTAGVVPAGNREGHEGGETVTATPKRILLIEDNTEAAALLALKLRLEGHTVSVAATGPDALDLARHDNPCDVVICDHVLPGMDGATLLRQLWKI